MRLLELFSGTGSIGRAFTEQGWEVISLDSDPKTEATIHEDILTWDYTVFPPGHFDAIWASPCCTHYSCARRGAKTPRNLPLADSLVLRSREIINYFNPRVWFIENPQTGLLKDRPFMTGLPFCDVDYCCYCDWGYRKRTRMWNNASFQGLLCQGRGLCESMDGGKHKTTAQQGKNRCKGELYGTHFSQISLHKIPADLCNAIEKCARLAL
jgi:site-specific DNA-cytosine methylase